MALTDKLTAIANAIRGKTGKTDALTLDQMAIEVDGLQIGGGEDLLAKRIDGTLTEYSNSDIAIIRNYAFYEYTYIKNASFQSVTTIGEYAFNYCTNLTSIHIPIATSIGVNAFAGCYELKSSNFPLVTSIGKGAFSYCKAMTNVCLPSVTIINDTVFSGCASLETIDIPLVTRIGSYAFNNCTNLTNIAITQSESVCTLANTNSFKSTPIASGTGYIYVPDALVEDYKAATNWSTYADQIKPLSEWEAANA